MKYNPDFLNIQPIFNEAEKQELLSLSAQMPISVLLGNERNIREIGIDFVHSSAQLEGNTYDKYDTLTLLNMGITAAGKLYSDAVMLMNLRASYELMVRALKQPFEGWKNFIKDTHAKIAKDLVPDFEMGVVRQGEVRISGTDYTPLVKPENLNAELDFLCKMADKITDPFDRALYLHNNIAYLQYFRDCNKRTARNAMTFSLLQAGLFPCVFPPESYPAYSKAILSYYETGRYDLMKDYFSAAYAHTAAKFGVEVEPDSDYCPR